MYIRKSLVIICIIIAVLMLSACSSTATITVSISFPDGSGQKSVTDQEVTVPKDATVLDVLSEYAADNNLEVITSGDPQYVVGIGGINNTDYEAWIYTVNGDYIEDIPSEKILNNKDTVEWTFGDKSKMQDGGQ